MSERVAPAVAPVPAKPAGPVHSVNVELPLFRQRTFGPVPDVEADPVMKRSRSPSWSKSTKVKPGGMIQRANSHGGGRIREFAVSEIVKDQDAIFKRNREVWQIIVVIVAHRAGDALLPLP